ncbi:hypothetical protein OAF42_04415 [Planctomicrobium sp.]|nr:hypothetical protein [Planctomicrobium sp.]
MRVSGVTLLEKSLEKTKPGYASYVQRTNAFFPGPPRSQCSLLFLSSLAGTVLSLR